jgi:hypothetical protein
MYLAYIHSWRGVVKPSQWGVMCHIGLCGPGLGWVNVYLPFSLRSLDVYCLMQTSTQRCSGFDMQARGRIAVLSITRKLLFLRKKLLSTTLMYSIHLSILDWGKEQVLFLLLLLLFVFSSIAYRFNVWHLLTNILISGYVVRNIKMYSLFHPFKSIFTLNPSTQKLNPSAQRCLTRFLLGILFLEPCISLIYALKTNKCNYSFGLLIMYGSSYMFRHYMEDGNVMPKHVRATVHN